MERTTKAQRKQYAKEFFGFQSLANVHSGIKER